MELFALTLLTLFFSIVTLLDTDFVVETLDKIKNGNYFSKNTFLLYAMILAEFVGLFLLVFFGMTSFIPAVIFFVILLFRASILPILEKDKAKYLRLDKLLFILSVFLLFL